MERITPAYLVHEIFQFFTHLQKGFLFTTRQLIVNPGETVVGFIKGKRKQYYPPISYFLVWISIYALSLYRIQHLFGENRVIDYNDYFGPGTSTQYAVTHLAVVLTMVIPFMALYFDLLFTRKRYNFFECIVVAVYCLGTVIFFQFVFAVLSLFKYMAVRDASDLMISDLLKIAYVSWFALAFSNSIKPGRWSGIRIVGFILLSFGTFTLWRMYGFPYLNHFFHHG